MHSPGKRKQKCPQPKFSVGSSLLDHPVKWIPDSLPTGDYEALPGGAPDGAFPRRRLAFGSHPVPFLIVNLIFSRHFFRNSSKREEKPESFFLKSVECFRMGSARLMKFSCLS
jgi:hypothetical protein